MLIEINLLPKKEKRRLNIIIPIIFFLCMGVAGSVFLGLKYVDLKKEYANLEQNLITTKKIHELEEKNLQSEKIPQEVKELEDAVHWAVNYPISTVFMLKHLTSLLPERGFIMDFNYQNDGIVNLTAQFDTNREIAFYLKRLTNSKFITEASLEEIHTVDINDIELNDKIIPRYNADFYIRLNNDSLKQELNEEDN